MRRFSTASRSRSILPCSVIASAFWARRIASRATLRRFRLLTASNASTFRASVATASCRRECATAFPCRRVRGRGSWPAPSRWRWRRRDKSWRALSKSARPRESGEGRGLAMPPGGLALVEECLHAFASFGRCARFGDAANGQRLERVVDRATRDLGYQPFRARLGVWTSGEQSRNPSLDRLVGAGRRNDFVHEAQSARVRGGKRLSGKEVAAGCSGADGRENVRADRRGDEADPYLRDREHRLFGGDRDITRCHQPDARGVGRAIDPGYWRPWQPLYAAQHRPDP